MEKNDIVEVICSGLGTQGEGIAKKDGVTLFVPRLLPGERAEVRVLKVKGSIGYARVEEVLTPAEMRVRPKCPVFGKCGGCQLQHIRYHMQLRFKTGLVRDALKKIAGLDVPVAACERSDREYGYRNKLQLPVGRRDGENVVGFFCGTFAQNRAHAGMSPPCGMVGGVDLGAALFHGKVRPGRL